MKLPSGCAAAPPAGATATIAAQSAISAPSRAHQRVIAGSPGSAGRSAACSGEKCGLVASASSSAAIASPVGRSGDRQPGQDHPAAVVDGRIAPAQCAGPLDQGERLGVAAGRVQRPGQRLRGEDALPAAPLGLGQPDRLGRVPVVGGQQRGGHVVGRALRGVEPPLLAEKPVLGPGLGQPAGRLQQLAVLEQVLGQRHAPSQPVVGGDRLVDPTAGGEHLGPALQQRRVARGGGESALVVGARLLQTAAAPGQLTDVVVAEGQLVAAGRGAQRALERRPRLVDATVQLELVGRPGERRHPGTQLEHALHGRGGGRGVAELSGRVGEHPVRLHAGRVERQRLLGVGAGGGEVVAGVGQRAQPDRGGGVARGPQLRRPVEGALRLGVVGGVAAHPGLLDVGRAERGPGSGVAGHPAQPLLRLRDGGGEPVRHRLRGPGRGVPADVVQPGHDDGGQPAARRARPPAEAAGAGSGRGPGERWRP